MWKLTPLHLGATHLATLILGFFVAHWSAKKVSPSHSVFVRERAVLSIPAHVFPPVTQGNLSQQRRWMGESELRKIPSCYFDHGEVRLLQDKPFVVIEVPFSKLSQFILSMERAKSTLKLFSEEDLPQKICMSDVQVTYGS